MTRYVALLRAVNVGGTGKLAMSDLRAMCEAAGFANVRTYIASGNVVFDSAANEATVKSTLERAQSDYAGKAVGVIVRTGSEMADVLTANPFKHAAPNRVVAVFLDDPPPANWRESITGVHTEEFSAGSREIFIHYPRRPSRHEAEDGSVQGRHRSQHEHGRETRGDGGVMPTSGIK